MCTSSVVDLSVVKQADGMRAKSRGLTYLYVLVVIIEHLRKQCSAHAQQRRGHGGVLEGFF